MNKYEWEKFGGDETALNTETGERLYMGGACIELNRLTERVAELEKIIEDAPEWISVDDYYPPLWDSVIVPGGVAYWSGREWFSITGISSPHPGCAPERRIEWHVTHWMPIPQPPNNKSISLIDARQALEDLE